MPNCPNHDDSQICPDCTYRPSGVKPAGMSPLDRHKADLEMIIGACKAAGVDAHSASALNAYERIAKLATTLRSRVPIDNPVQPSRLRGGEIVTESTDGVVTKTITDSPVIGSCSAIKCRWYYRGADAHERAVDHSMQKGHPVTVGTLTASRYERVAGGQR
jgi:hypothetical protein